MRCRAADPRRRVRGGGVQARRAGTRPAAPTCSHYTLRRPATPRYRSPGDCSAGARHVAEARGCGSRQVPTGGLAAELFPTPVELAAVICACRDRELPFKLAAGLRHALRHTDPETGFTHHGFLNVLVATGGASAADVARRRGRRALADHRPVPLVEPARARNELREPPLLGPGSAASSVPEPLTDLIRLGLMNGGQR